MAKFAVGEIALVAINPSPKCSSLGYSHGMQVEVTSIPGDAVCRCCGRNKYYLDGYSVKCAGAPCVAVLESYLRKLPGDSTSLPSWLTNMLKVPQGDTDKVKQPEKVK